MFGEVEWSDSPDTLRRTDSVAILRAGTGATPALIVLSERVLGVELHWWQGRSTPHIKGKCPACEAKRPAVWKGYIAVYNPKTHVVNILEITPCCIDPLSVYRQAFGTLRGGLLTLSRSNTKKNGRLTATIMPSNFPLSGLPPCPDVQAALVFMWAARRHSEGISYQTPRDEVDGPGTNEELGRKRPDRQAPHPDQQPDEDATVNEQPQYQPEAKPRERIHPEMSVMFNSDGEKPAENDDPDQPPAAAAVPAPPTQPPPEGSEAKQFTTEGTGVSPIYTASADQKLMLYRNKMENRAKRLKAKGDAA
jgi:hypothetical protein